VGVREEAFMKVKSKIKAGIVVIKGIDGDVPGVTECDAGRVST
jgi:hypothetical protein